MFNCHRLDLGFCTALNQSVQKLPFLLTSNIKNYSYKNRGIPILNMQHITRIPCKRRTINYLEYSISADNPVRYIDAFVANRSSKAS